MYGLLPLYFYFCHMKGPLTAKEGKAISKHPNPPGENLLGILNHFCCNGVTGKTDLYVNCNLIGTF